MKRIHNSPTPARIEPIQRPGTAIDRRPMIRPPVSAPTITESLQADRTYSRLPRRGDTEPFRNRVLRNRNPSPSDYLRVTSGIGKKCAIIGNAHSIFDKRQGDLIDSFDVVCRINSDRIVNHVDQGAKTDVIFVHNGTESKIPYLATPKYTVVNINKHAVDLFDDWTVKVRAGTNQENARPSTGLIAIAFMLRLGYNISLFGFDWYATPTHYTQAFAWKNHYPEWEKEQIQILLNTTF